MAIPQFSATVIWLEFVEVDTEHAIHDIVLIIVEATRTECWCTPVMACCPCSHRPQSRRSPS